MVSNQTSISDRDLRKFLFIDQLIVATLVEQQKTTSVHFIFIYQT